mmetsp:Transcript_30468/g.45060  ORF Transcript_30468/g.45060 Transcript_30468/m.45060 type:complete len:531 (-) Transcript_30468:297-1889(-)
MLHQDYQRIRKWIDLIQKNVRDRKAGCRKSVAKTEKGVSNRSSDRATVDSSLKSRHRSSLHASDGPPWERNSARPSNSSHSSAQSEVVAIPHATLVVPSPVKPREVVTARTTSVEKNEGLFHNRRKLCMVSLLFLIVGGIAVGLALVMKGDESTPDPVVQNEFSFSAVTPTDTSAAIDYLGEGECRQGNGDYPLLFTIKFDDLSPWKEDGNGITAANRCVDLCLETTNRDWCFASELTVRDFMSSPECSLITDRLTFEAAGNIMQDDSWGGTQIINRDIYETYCHGGGSCDGTTNWDGGGFNERNGYHCYLMKEDATIATDSPDPTEPDNELWKENSDMTIRNEEPTRKPTRPTVTEPVSVSSLRVTPRPSHRPSPFPKMNTVEESTCPKLVGKNTGCDGCRKDFKEGAYVFCTSSYVDNNRKDCGWGYNADCSFEKIYPLSMKECNDSCLNEVGCTHFSYSNDGSCYLYLVKTCNQNRLGDSSFHFESGYNAGSAQYQFSPGETFTGIFQQGREDDAMGLYIPCEDMVR